jgi:uncharacterized protein YjbI with pentapeptide repeats
MSGPPSIVSLGFAASDAVVWRSPGQLQVTLIVKATFRLDETMAALPPEEIHRAERYLRGNATNSVLRADDLAPHRSRAEVLFTGHAHAPGGQPVAAHAARLGVFRDHPLIDKTLHIYGDRSGGGAAPASFLKMPIVHERAFGGPGWDANPIGVGFSASKEPNLTAANIVNPADPALTAGFGPLSRNWRIRRRLLGKTSRKDIDRAIAEIPSDFDWSYFHSAPADQRCELLHGDEWIVLDGLHPERPRIQVRLPGARALARVQGLGRVEQALELRADTLHIDGDEGLCSLVWRSTIPVADEAQLASLSFVVGVERPGAPIAWPETAPLSRRAPQASPPSAQVPLPAPADLPPPQSPFEGTLAVDPEALEAQSKRPAIPFKAGSPWAIPTTSADVGRPSPARTPAEAVKRASRDDGDEGDANEGTLATVEVVEVKTTGPILPFRYLVPPTLAAAPRAPAPPSGPLPPALTPLPPLPTPPRAIGVPPGKIPGSAQFFHRAPRLDDAGAEAPPRASGDRDRHPGPLPRTAVVPPRAHDGIPIVNATSLVAFTLPLQPKPSQDARAVVIKGTFDLVADGPAKLRAETDLPSGDLHAGDEMMRSVLYPSDFVPFKPKADVTLKGHAYAPGGSSPAALARFRFGRGKAGFERQIAVFGERSWQQTVVKLAPTEPARFERIPIVHELAFGGPGFDRNPMGRGYGAATSLPCLEDPAHLIKSPGDAPLPMSFGAVPMLWRERWSRLGSYGGDWLKTRWPYFPDDFDWAFFQAAPPAQQLDRVEGDEPFEIVGMHPDHPLLRGSLPRLAPRAFAQKTTESGGALVEIVLRLDTVTLDVDEMKLNLVWRGLLEVRDDEASEIAELFVMVEPLAGAHADLADARAKYLAMKGPAAPSPREDGASMARDEANAPPPAWAASSSSVAGAAAAASVAAAAATEPRERVPPHLDPVRREVVARLARGESFEHYDAAGADLSDLDFSGRSLAGANLKEAILQRCRFVGADLTGAQLSSSNLTDAVLDDANLTLADLTGANLESARLDRADLTFADLGRARGERASFREATGKRTSFAGGAWAKARFDRATIAGPDFTGATLDEAVFDGAVMPEIRLYDARAAKASFDDATLTEARADGVTLTRCSLKSVSAASSIWDGAVLDETSFRGAILTAAGFNKASGSRAVFSGADLAGARLERAKFPGASLLKANLMEASLLGADLTSADLRGANLHGADTWKTKLKGAQLELAVLTKTKLKGRA